MAQLIVQQLTKEFPTRAEPLRVLRDVSLSLDVGQSAAILGPSGSGKSTLLHILGTLQRPSSGSMRLGDVDPFTLGDAGLAKFRNERIGFVFQDHHLLPQLSALENILVPVLATGKPTRPDIERARELLDRVGLTARIDHRPAELSGGERQRVATARALINRPTLILADEPTGNLDRANAHQIAELLGEMQTHDEAKPIMLVVTHSAALAAQFDQRWELNDGVLNS
jgi:lipoprotein-releasing system ATP-binding protein